MTIRHHLSDHLLQAYAAGQLAEGFNLVIASHISLCDTCRARLGAYDALGGAVLQNTAEVALSQDSFAACLARAKMMPPAPLPKRKVLSIPQPLADYIGGDLDAVKWRPLGLGARQAILPTAKNSASTVRLLSIPGGAAMPQHSHSGLELTLVLQGAFSDEADHFGPGDVEIGDANLDHTPIAVKGSTCICLAATDAPLRFKALLPRLTQAFFRI